MARQFSVLAVLLLLVSVTGIGLAAPIKISFSSMRQSVTSAAPVVDVDDIDSLESPEPSESPEVPEDLLPSDAVVTVPSTVTAAIVTTKFLPVVIPASELSYSFDGFK